MPIVHEINSNSNLSTAPSIWAKLLDELRTQMDDRDFSNWIEGIEFVAEVDGEIVLTAPSAFHRDRVQANHMRRIQSLWTRLDLSQRRVRLAIWEELPEDIRVLADTTQSETDPNIANDYKSAKKTASGYSGQSYGFDTLVTGPSNDLAVEMAKRMANNDPLPTQIVMLYGSQGVGKTHILRSVEQYAREHMPDMATLYMSAEAFMLAFVEGVKQRDTSVLKRQLRSADLLLIDDLQAIGGKSGTQKEFFANIRALMSNGGRVLMTADASPSNLSSLNHRVREELLGNISIEITEPDPDMRKAIIRMKATQIANMHPQFQLSEDMVELIASNVRGPGRQLYGAVCNIYTATSFAERELTLKAVSQVLIRQKGESRPPSIDMVKRAVIEVFNTSKADLESQRRSRQIAYPRQIAMYICRNMTTRSYPQIGRMFGKRDHTTVLYAVRKIEGMISKDTNVSADVEKVMQALRNYEN